MASIVIHDLEARADAAGGSICVAYVYFRYSDVTGLTIRAVLEILVKQTVERHPDCAPLAMKIFSRHVKERTQPTEAELFELLSAFVKAKSLVRYAVS